ncbi:MAG: replication protein RepA, partial [Pseudomonadota bacterium]|nr:replication protein RepA [Pseudomonadota bacterium]
SEGFSRGAIVRSGLRFHAEDTGQGLLWEDRVVLDETFYQALRDHPVPLLEAAIRQLRDRSMSLDIYVWLAYRLHRVDRATPISWSAVYNQFGTGFRALRQFKPRFAESLAAAVAAYPEARVSLGEQGLALHPARPPVARIAAGSSAAGSSTGGLAGSVPGGVTAGRHLTPHPGL